MKKSRIIYDGRPERPVINYTGSYCKHRWIYQAGEKTKTCTKCKKEARA